MPTEPAEENEQYAATLARAVGYLCVVAAGLKDEPLLHSATFLIGLGYSRADCAAILNTTAETVRVTLAQAKTAGNQRRKKRRSGAGKTNRSGR